MIVLMGVAGAGKSVQGKLLAEKLKYEWVSTGELLRRELSNKRRDEMLQGKLLADTEIIKVIDQYFSSSQESQRCILDGFPRTLAQAEWLLAQQIKIEAVLHLKASEEVVKKRLLKRGRPDDNEQAIDNRFLEYEKHTLPIVDLFKRQSVPVYDVGGEGDVKTVHQNILSKLREP